MPDAERLMLPRKVVVNAHTGTGDLVRLRFEEDYMSAHDEWFLEIARGMFGDRLANQLRVARTSSPKKLTTEREARELERRLRQAPRETAP